MLDAGSGAARPILGNSPEWYRTPNYRRRLVRWPRQVLAEFGLYLSDDIEVRVQDSNQKHRFMVMPMRPEGTDGWTEDQLVEIITRDCLMTLAREEGLRVAERDIDRTELYVAEEAFFSGTGAQVAPCVSIDGRPVRL